MGDVGLEHDLDCKEVDLDLDKVCLGGGGVGAFVFGLRGTLFSICELLV